MSNQEKHPRPFPDAVPVLPPLPLLQQTPQTSRPSETVISFPEYNVNTRYDPVYGNGNETEEEETAFKNLDFSEKSLRRSFIKKVYAIVLAQLAVTGGFILLCRKPEVMEVLNIRENMWIIYTAMAVYIGVYIAILCCEAPRRRVPYNFIFLSVFTLAISFLVGIATSFTEGSDVLIAFGVTMALVAGLTLFAFQTKIDFTMMSGSLFSIFLCVLIFGIIAACTSPDKEGLLHMLYSGLVVILFSLYLVYDTQMMIGGTHKYTISPEEYIFAALCIYMDIMNLFLRILRLLRYAK